MRPLVTRSSARARPGSARRSAVGSIERIARTCGAWCAGISELGGGGCGGEVAMGWLVHEGGAGVDDGGP
jgi:hypothetical protein